MTEASSSRVEDVLRLYLLLDQQDRLYREFLRAFNTPTHALAQSANAWHRKLPNIAAHYLRRHEQWPEGPDAVPIYQQWRQSLAWLTLPNCGLWIDEAAHEQAWPMALMQLKVRPPLLFWQGEESVLGLPQIAIVGSRSATRQGIDIARDISQKLARAGFTITSGLASGIDGAAHEGALAGSGLTLAVMGCGLDKTYPPRHRLLAEKIVSQGGLLVSEFAPATAAAGWHFPRRNRVISALALGTLVVEAGPRSGSLITAQACDQMSRPVWAVPGSIYSLQSQGCHELIRCGQAQLVETAADIISDIMPTVMRWFGHELHQTPLLAGTDLRSAPSNRAQQLLDSMAWHVSSVDELVQASQLSAQHIMITLGELEVAGWVAPVAGGYQRLPA